MRIWILICLALVLSAQNPSTAGAQGVKPGPTIPTYTADGRLVFPTGYREWIYLSSGVDMSYSPNMSMDHSMFDNVFVNPEAYRAFVATGTWPDNTMLVLEARMAGSKGSINKTGHYQTGDVMAREVHVKRRASRESGRSSGSETTSPRSRSPPAPIAIPATNNMRRWIRRSCSSIRRCWRSQRRKGR